MNRIGEIHWIGTYIYVGEIATDYSEAIRLRPQFADARNVRGLALIYGGDYDRAITDFTEALRVNPQFAGTHNSPELFF
jgi:lipoprotein NlpI